jgi:hypothetical protein
MGTKRVMRLRYEILAILLLLAATPAEAQVNPVPFVSQPLVPASAAPGGADLTLTVRGTGFVSRSVVNWNGRGLVTTLTAAN